MQFEDLKFQLFFRGSMPLDPLKGLLSLPLRLAWHIIPNLVPVLEVGHPPPPPPPPVKNPGYGPV